MRFWRTGLGHHLPVRHNPIPNALVHLGRQHPSIYQIVLRPVRPKPHNPLRPDLRHPRHGHQLGNRSLVQINRGCGIPSDTNRLRRYQRQPKRSSSQKYPRPNPLSHPAILLQSKPDMPLFSRFAAFPALTNRASLLNVVLEMQSHRHHRHHHHHGTTMPADCCGLN